MAIASVAFYAESVAANVTAASIADSKGVSAGTVASTADSKAEDASMAASTADSKAVAASSTFDDKGVKSEPAASEYKVTDLRRSSAGEMVVRYDDVAV